MAKVDEKALVAKQATDVALQEMFGGEEDSVFHEIGAGDFTIPRLRILQDGSPVCKKADAANYIEGAEAGMIFNSVTSHLYDGGAGIELIPVHYRKTFVEWKDRNIAGGGFVRDWGLVEGLKQEKTTTLTDKGKKVVLPNGNHLIETMEYVVQMVTANGFFPCVLDMTSSQLTPAKKMNAQLRTMKIDPENPKSPLAPIYWRSWNFKTNPETKDSYSWFNWKITPSSTLIELSELFPWMENDWKGIVNECKQFRELVQKDAVKIQPMEGEGEAEPKNITPENAPM